MESKIRLLKKNRKFSKEFKLEMVALYEQGDYSVLQLSKLYGISRKSIYDWIYKFSVLNERGIRIVEMKDSNIKKLDNLFKKVKELERIVGQKQIKIDFLEKVIDVADKELKIDIKKKSNTSQLTGSKTTTQS